MIITLKKAAKFSKVSSNFIRNLIITQKLNALKMQVNGHGIKQWVIEHPKEHIQQVVKDNAKYSRIKEGKRKVTRKKTQGKQESNSLSLLKNFISIDSNKRSLILKIANKFSVNDLKTILEF